jgi:hypothetical protein
MIKTPPGQGYVQGARPRPVAPARRPSAGRPARVSTQFRARGLPPSGGRGIAFPVSFLDQGYEHVVE